MDPCGSGSRHCVDAGDGRAEPDRFPDLSHYVEADASAYNTYGNYPTTSGLQFSTPGGYRCRMTFTGKANSWMAAC